MIQHLFKYILLLILLFSGNNFLFKNNLVSAQSFQVRSAGDLKIIQGRKIGKSSSFQVRDGGGVVQNRTLISTTIEGVAPPSSIEVSTGSAPTSENSINRGSGRRETYDASKWLLNKKYEELVLEGKSKPHLTSAPKNNGIIFDKHGKPFGNRDENYETEKNIIKNNSEENISQKNNLKNFLTQKSKDLKNMDLKEVPRDISKNSNEFSKKLLASIVFDLKAGGRDLDNFGFKTSAPSEDLPLGGIISIEPREEKIIRKEKTLSCSNLMSNGSDYWKDLSVKLLWVLTLLVIIIFLLAILVICMYYEKKINKKIMPFWKKIAKFIGILSLMIFFVPLVNASSLQIRKTEISQNENISSISYEVKIQENKNSKLEVSGDLKKGERKVVNINDVYLWIFNQEGNKKSFKSEKKIQFDSTKDTWKNLAYLFKNISFILIGVLIFIIFLIFIKCAQKNCNFIKKDNRKKITRKKAEKISKKKNIKKTKKILSLIFGIISVFNFSSNLVEAATTTTPQLLIYEGDLLDTSGNPLAGSYNFRFSLWTNTDFEATDVVAGVINVLAPDYLGWTEVQTETLSLGGSFSLKMGTVTPFGLTLFNQDNSFLQVEIKSSADPDTSYEVIDINLDDTTEDRKVIASVPYAFNANRLDYRDLGYGLGEIPYIDEITGKLPTAIIPASAAALIGGVNGNMFTLDVNGDALPTDDLKFEFGSGLGKFLAWSQNNNQFEFNDNLSVTGNLIVSGTINGVTVGPKDQKIILSPRYPNSIFDGTGDNGYMYEETETISGNEKNIIRWKTNNTLAQEDYSNIIRYTLPSNFTSFKTPAISIFFKTLGALTDSKIDFTIQKEGSVADELLAAGIGLNSGSWTNSSFNLNPATTWNAEDTMILKIKMYAKGAAEPKISDISLSYMTN